MLCSTKASCTSNPRQQHLDTFASFSPRRLLVGSLCWHVEHSSVTSNAIRSLICSHALEAPAVAPIQLAAFNAEHTHTPMIMAPDLNSVPISSRNLTASTSSQSQAPAPLSRSGSRTSSMGVPPLPLASSAGAIPASSQGSQPFPSLSPLATGSSAHPAGETGAGLPMRHPRPLNAAEMHLELEKEQEALVCFAFVVYIFSSLHVRRCPHPACKSEASSTRYCGRVFSKPHGILQIQHKANTLHPHRSTA